MLQQTTAGASRGAAAWPWRPRGPGTCWEDPGPGALTSHRSPSRKPLRSGGFCSFKTSPPANSWLRKASLRSTCCSRSAESKPRPHLKEEMIPFLWHVGFINEIL